ncbi:hypothetical protein BGW42_006987 [Actinomortierella wolfii]|nr:hypothetical protein BGW42_006987 [Actinomortierella wolfii]
MSDHQLLFAVVGFGVLLVALLFCHAYGISNQYIYMPLSMFLGYRLSSYLINKFYPNFYDPVPPPAPKTRQEKKKLAKETQQNLKREKRLAQLERNAKKKSERVD